MDVEQGWVTAAEEVAKEVFTVMHKLQGVPDDQIPLWDAVDLADRELFLAMSFVPFRVGWSLCAQAAAAAIMGSAFGAGPAAQQAPAADTPQLVPSPVKVEWPWQRRRAALEAVGTAPRQRVATPRLQPRQRRNGRRR